jgi:hypothetical protein
VTERHGAARRGGRSRLAASGLAIALIAAAPGAGCHRFDRSQVPVITVGPGLRPAISWAPSPAYELTMYAGDKDGNGFGAIWTARGPGGYENALPSPVTYGVPPTGTEFAGAPPLQAGRTYTVTVTRKDERGSGDGFTNTRHRYVGTKTFVAKEE